MTPLISVIIPSKNSGATLESAIRSVLDQKYPRVECLVIDGGSSDGTLEILKKYDGRLAKWVSRPDGGVYEAMNAGARLARGERLYFMGADDVLSADLSELAGRMDDPRAVYYGDVRFKRSGRIYAGRFNALKLMRRNICHQAIFYPRCVFESYEYNVRYPVLADYDFNVRLWRDGFQFRRLECVVTLYNDGGKSEIERDDAFRADRVRLMTGLAAAVVRRKWSRERS